MANEPPSIPTGIILTSSDFSELLPLTLWFLVVRSATPIAQLKTTEVGEDILILSPASGPVGLTWMP